MADGQNGGGGVHSKDHARRWDTINNVDMLVMQPRKQQTVDKNSSRGNRNWQFLRISVVHRASEPVLDCSLGMEGSSGYEPPMILLVGTP